MRKRVAVIGAGFSGIASAAYAARDGHEVHVFEKNDTAGGRARQFTSPEGFVFDMGPSWYWMPDIIQDFFKDFGDSTDSYFKLHSLNPQFEMVFKESKISVPENFEEFKNLFESIEKGAGKKLEEFMASAEYKYNIGMKEFVNKPCYSWMEFVSWKIIKSAFNLDLLSNFRDYVSRYFRDFRLRALMEFPVIFLGASPKKIPALYSMMNYGGYILGTKYPEGGFYSLVKAMKSIAESQGAKFHFKSNIKSIENTKSKINITVNSENLSFDAVISSADYHHTETLLKSASDKNYDEKYWQKKTFAPSCLIFYLGFSKKIAGLKHHTLFFENDLDNHINSIYKKPEWPDKPLFYCCCPSVTDSSVAPEGYENVFLLMPVANNLKCDDTICEKYLDDMIERIEKHTGIAHLKNYIIYKRSYCVDDFRQDYNAYGGNAYGLANTLSQTAVLKPSIRNKKMKNFFYTGQLTVPGPGVPPSIISGKLVAIEMNKTLKTL